MNLVQNGGVAVDLDSGLVYAVAPASSGDSAVTSAEFYYCTAVSTEAGTWSGQKWEWSETGYVKSDEVTTGLAYGERFTPVAGQSYNAEATVRVSKMDRAGRSMSLYDGAIGSSRNWGDYFSGYIAAARIYDSALDESGILSLAGEFSPVVA